MRDVALEMVKIASSTLGKDVLQMYFQDIDFSQEFDAIWACASLLHVPYDELKKVLQKLHRALRPSGIFYASFKYGHSSRQKDDRSFFDMDEKSIQPYLADLFQPIETWKSEDTCSQVAPGPYKAWLNIICRSI